MSDGESRTDPTGSTVTPPKGTSIGDETIARPAEEFYGSAGVPDDSDSARGTGDEMAEPTRRPGQPLIGKDQDEDEETRTVRRPQSAPASGDRITQVKPMPTLDARAESPVKRPHTTRRARLRLSQVDPWSVMKNAFVFSAAFGVAMIVLVLLLWAVLSATGVFELINSTADSVLRSPDDTESFRFQDFFGLGQTLGLTILVSVLNLVLLTALATLGAFLYNISARLVGGVDVTLSEE